MLSRKPRPIHRGHLFMFAAMAVILMAAEGSCDFTQFVTVQVCNGDATDKVLVVVEVQHNHQQQTLAPGVCLGVGGAPFNGMAVPYRISLGDTLRYRAEMSALRDELDRLTESEISSAIQDRVLEIREQITAITRAGVGEACSGVLRPGEQLRVTVSHETSGSWACGQKTLITPKPSESGP